MRDVDLEEVDPAVDPRWEDLTRGDGGDVFQSAPWIRCVTEPYGFEPRAILASRDGVPVGGIPFVEVDGAGGHRIIAGPFSDYCDPVLEADVWSEIAGWLHNTGLPVRYRFLRFGPPGTPELRVADRAHWHGLELGGDPEAILQRMHPSARRAISKSAKQGVEVVEGRDLDDLRAFYDLHVQVRRAKYRLLAQPFSFFEKIWHEFIESGNGRLALARASGEVVAGVLFLEWQDRVYYKFNASNDASLALRPNDAIVWSAIVKGCEDGKMLLDFGLSDWEQDGLARYKEKFGAEAGIIQTFEDGPPSRAPAVSSALGTATELLTDPSVPAEVTAEAGARLYRWFV